MINQKKAGILTFHRALNYGAVLQAFALKQMLNAIGFDSCVIDYRSKCIEAQHFKLSLFRPKHFLKLMYHLKPFSYFAEISMLAKNLPLFNSFVKEHLDVSAKCSNAKNIPQDIDLYIIGSDQLWNKDITKGKFNKVYLGNFTHPASSKIITYAVSANTKSIADCADYLNKATSNISEISIREASLANVFHEKTGREVRQDIDPTLLADRTIWTPLLNDNFKDRNYVLVYEVRGKAGYRTKLMDIANRIAKENGWEVIKINQNFRSDKMYSVEDFLSLFNDAQLVLTSSFHGTAFSLIFHKTFYTFTLNDGSDARYVDILNAVGLSSRIKPVEDDVTEISPVDYTIADKRWEELRTRSLNYLKKYL